MTGPALTVADGPIEEMGIDHLRILEATRLAIAAAHRLGLPLPIRSQIDDFHVVLFFSRHCDLRAWGRFVDEPVTKTRLLTGRKILGVDVELMQVPFRLVCAKPVAS